MLYIFFQKNQFPPNIINMCRNYNFNYIEFIPEGLNSKFAAECFEKCTSPLKANLEQKILYGKVLVTPHLYPSVRLF